MHRYVTCDQGTSSTYGSIIPFAGQKFAQYEIKTVISKILSQYKVEAVDGFNLRYAYELILRPINGIQLKLVKRT